jgi:hypothetical protein
MIAECTQDLYTKLAAVQVGTATPLAQSVGLTVGGQGADPGMVQIPLPAAWILPASGVNQTPENLLTIPPRTQLQLSTYVVMLHLPYTNQGGLLTNEYPLLEAVQQTINGTTAPGGSRWWCKGYKLEAINKDRLIYEVQFITYQAIVAQA